MKAVKLFGILCLALMAGCAHYATGEMTLPDGTVSKMAGNCVTNPISPTACYYANYDCKTEKQLGQEVEVCKKTDALIATQGGWVDPSQIGAAALIGKGLRDSRSTVNQTNTQTGGGASANAFAKGGKAYSNSRSSSAAFSHSSSTSNNCNGVFC